MSEDKILIAGAFRFPDGDAAAARVLGLGKCLREFGVIVEFMGWESSPRNQDQDGGGGWAYQGFQYRSQGDLRFEKLSPMKRLLRFLFSGKNTLKSLERYEGKSDIKAIIAYHGGSYFVWKLKKYCKKNKIRLIVDCTEWYECNQMIGGKYGVVALDNYIRMRILNNYVSHIICISKFLCNYYRSKGRSVIEVPPLVDISERKWELDKEVTACGVFEGGRFLKIIYAGNPGKKDLIVPVFEAIRMAKNAGYNIVFEIVGPSREDLLNTIGYNNIEGLEDRLIFRGKVPQEIVPSFLMQAHFSIIVRPYARYSEAGFPTKVVESLAAGVPVITNRTSNLSEFIKDKEEGLLIEGASHSDVFSTLKRAYFLTNSEYEKLRNKARLTAEEKFHYSNYSLALGKFVVE